MQAMGSLTPTLAGLGAPNAQLQAETLLQLGQNAGLGPQAMAGETQVYNSLAQMGSTPGLMQQYALAQVYGTKNLTAAPQYWQYQQSMQQQGMQLQGLTTPAKDERPPDLASMRIMPLITMGRVSIQAQQFSLAQNTAQFNEQQWVNTQELGPIGATPTQTGTVCLLPVHGTSNGCRV